MFGHGWAGKCVVRNSCTRYLNHSANAVAGNKALKSRSRRFLHGNSGFPGVVAVAHTSNEEPNSLAATRLV
jgi:hypothetical protein